MRDLTRAEIEGRRQALMAIEALRRFTPGFEDARLRTFGMTLGTRDSRKIVGRYDLTGHDVRGEARFEDSVGIFPEFIDGYGILVLPTTGRYFQVPYGILVPQGVDNLLVAGRCVAGDKISHAATRSQMCCAVTGQAAGAAAAVSLKEGRSTGEVDGRARPGRAEAAGSATGLISRLGAPAAGAQRTLISGDVLHRRSSPRTPCDRRDRRLWPVRRPRHRRRRRYA